MGFVNWKKKKKEFYCWTKEWLLPYNTYLHVSSLQKCAWCITEFWVEKLLLGNYPLWGLPWQSRHLRLCTALQGAWIQSLVGELRSCMPCGQKKEKRKLKNYKKKVTLFGKTTVNIQSYTYRSALNICFHFIFLFFYFGDGNSFNQKFTWWTLNFIGEFQRIYHMTTCVTWLTQRICEKTTERKTTMGY